MTKYAVNPLGTIGQTATAQQLSPFGVTASATYADRGDGGVGLTASVASQAVMMTVNTPRCLIGATMAFDATVAGDTTLLQLSRAGGTAGRLIEISTQALRIRSFGGASTVVATSGTTSAVNTLYRAYLAGSIGTGTSGTDQVRAAWFSLGNLQVPLWDSGWVDADLSGTDTLFTEARVGINIGDKIDEPIVWTDNDALWTAAVGSAAPDYIPLWGVSPSAGVIITADGITLPSAEVETTYTLTSPSGEQIPVTVPAGGKIIRGDLIKSGGVWI